MDFKYTAKKGSQKSFTSPADLFKFLQLKSPPSYFNPQVQASFNFLVPLSFAQRIQKNSPLDPLLLQVLPHLNELIDYPGYESDPLAESALINQSSILQKYQHRLLLMPTSACGIHCRYCFRRHFPYQEANVNKDVLKQQIQHIQNATDISEVILSGGDPLCLNDQKLAAIFAQLAPIKHLKRLRIHTRQLIVEPSRISSKLSELFKHYSLPIALVLHCNHANELTNEVKQQLAKLRFSHVQLLNQSVLLKGVNDDSDLLSRLSEKLYDFGVLPYYLHQLDHVAGSQHFAVEDKHAMKIVKQMQAQLPGYLVPNLVRENSGEKFKRRLG